MDPTPAPAPASAPPPPPVGSTPAESPPAAPAAPVSAGALTEAAEEPAVAWEPPAGAEFDAFKTAATEVGLDGAKSKKMFEAYQSVEKSRNEALEKSLTAQHEQWGEALKSDAEIGGPKFAASLTEARRAIKALDAADAVEVLKTTGLANNPAIFKLFVRIGRKLSDDSIAGTAASAGHPVGRLSDAEVFYPSTK